MSICAKREIHGARRRVEDDSHDDRCKDASASTDYKCGKWSVVVARGLSSVKTTALLSNTTGSKRGPLQ